MARYAAIRRAHGLPPLMGGKLRDWIQSKIAERKAKGLDLQVPVGKGSVGITIPGQSDSTGAGPSTGGPIEFVKKNPIVVAGVAGGALLITMLILKRRRK